MTAQEYLDTYHDQSLLYNTRDPSLRGQCVQAVCFYAVANHKPVIWADAYPWYAGGQFPDQYERIPNTPDAVPQAGDIIVWGPNLPGSGGAGHIAVCLQPLLGTGTFISVDQNWGGKTVHKVTHNYSYVVGWLRFKSQAPAPAPQQGDEMITTTDEAIKLYKMLRPNGGASDADLAVTVNKRSFAQFLNDSQGEINSRDTALRDQAEKLTELQTTIDSLNKTVTDLRGQDTADQAATKTALDQVASLTAQLTTTHDQLAELQAQLTAPVAPNPSSNWFAKIIAILLPKKQ